MKICFCSDRKRFICIYSNKGKINIWIWPFLLAFYKITAFRKLSRFKVRHHRI